MPAGDVYILPGGWCYKQRGEVESHLVLYVIMKELDPDNPGKTRFRFGVCNTGEGLQFHPIEVDPETM